MISDLQKCCQLTMQYLVGWIQRSVSVYGSLFDHYFLTSPTHNAVPCLPGTAFQGPFRAAACGENHAPQEDILEAKSYRNEQRLQSRALLPECTQRS